MKVALHWQILGGLILGVLVGSGARLTGCAHLVKPGASLVGALFMQLLHMIIIPLIMSSILSAVTSIGAGRRLGRLGGKTVVYYVSTSVCAILVGLLLVNLFAPGAGAMLAATGDVSTLPEPAAPAQLVLRMIPHNILASMARGDVLPIIFFCLLTGIAVTRLPADVRGRVARFFNDAYAVMMLLTRGIIRLAPVGVCALLADITLRNGIGVFVPLGKYMLVVLLGLGVHAAVTLPLLLRLVGRVRVAAVWRCVTAPLLTAFSTASSSATLPLTMHAVRRQAGVSDEISGFVLPLGATVNMDGTALYECVVALFIAQVYGIELGLGQQMVVVVTALLASIGAAGIPMAGLAMTGIILLAVGLPLEGLGLILAVDRVLDMCRTSVNVWSDTCGAVIIAASEREPLPALSARQPVER